MKYIIGLLTITIMFSCSTLSEQEYYKSAKKNYSNEKFEDAVSDFKEILSNYPESSLTAEAIFMVAFINANDLKNLDEAKVYYEQFIEKFPEHELTESAKYELANLGKDVNDLPIFKELDADTVKEISSK